MVDKIDVENIISLKTRLRTIETEIIRRDEQRKHAEIEYQAALAKLKQLGLTPENAEANLQQEYGAAVQAITDLEAILGL